MRLFRITVLFLGFLLAAGLPPVLAQTTEAAHPVLKVAYLPRPPFVMPTDIGLTGFAIEAWEHAAAKLGLRYEYKIMPTLPALLDAVSRAEVDVAVNNMPITRDRAANMDFTQPWYDGGLRIMVHETRRSGFWDFVWKLRDSGYLRSYMWICIGILCATVALTVFDRIFDPDFPRAWHKGAAESFYDVVSVATTGTASRHRLVFGSFGRVLAALFMIVGLCVKVYVISTVASVIATNALTPQIGSVADLSHKIVGANRGTVAEAFAKETALSLRSFNSLGEAMDALVDNQIAAVIGDAPVLEYYDISHPELPISVVGSVFRPVKYGFAVPTGSPLGRALSVRILEMHENGFLERLRDKYFRKRL